MGNIGEALMSVPERAIFWHRWVAFAGNGRYDDFHVLKSTRPGVSVAKLFSATYMCGTDAGNVQVSVR
jgi:hypothetical protein